jgi:hypothetical protein
MSKASRITLGIMAAGVLMVAIWYLRGDSTPSGQPRLTVLNQNNLSEFQLAFDSNSAGPRLLLLVSPT